MAYVPGNNNTRTEIIMEADSVATRDSSLVRMHHLPTTEQHERLLHDQQSTATMPRPQAELSGSYASEDIVNDNETSSYIDYTETMGSHCFPDKDRASFNSMSWRQNANNDSMLTPNRTLNSTPELPVCESSDLLDIPFASRFDLFDFQDTVVKTSFAMEVSRQCIGTTSPKLSVCSDTPRIEALKQSMKRMPTSYTDSPARHSNLKLTGLVNSQVRPSNCGSGEEHLPSGMLDEPKAVRPHSKSRAKPLEGVFDSGDENNNSHLGGTDVDFELEDETGDYTHDQSLHKNSEDKFRYHPERSSFFRTDTKFNTLPLSSEGSSRVLFPCLAASSQLNVLCSTNGDTLQPEDNREHKMPSKTPASDNFINTERCLDITSGNSSCSDCDLSDKPQHCVVKQESKTPVSYRNASWSYHTLPDIQHNTPTSNRGRDSLSNDRYITVRAKPTLWTTLELEDAETASAAKCRRGNDTPATSVSSSSRHARSAKQRLPFRSPLKPAFVDQHHHTTSFDVFDPAAHTLSSARTIPYIAGSGKCKSGLQQSSKHSHHPSEVRLSQRKPLADHDVRRKPLTGLAIAGHSNYNVPAEPTNCLRMSLGKNSDICENAQDAFLSSQDSDICETLQETSLPSYKDYNLHRGINCCFTGTKQRRDNNVMVRKVPVLRPHKDHERVYTLRDPATNEILERKVEGAENLPPSSVLLMKRQTSKVFRTVAHNQRQHTQYRSHNKKAIKQTRGRMLGVSLRKLDRSSNMRTHSRKAIQYFRETSPNNHNSRCTMEKGYSTESTKTSIHESHRTHPIACSTLIRDHSANSDTKNISTWTLSEKSCLCNFQKSNFCSTRINSKLHALPVFEGTDISKSSFEYQPNGKAFEISSMVSQIDKRLNHNRLISNTEMDNLRKDTTSSTFQRHKLSKVIENAFPDYSFSTDESPSQMKSTSNSSGTPQFIDTGERSCSASRIEQTNTSCVVSNQATVSITCTPSEENNTLEPNHWSYECKLSGLTSAEGSITDSESYSDADDISTTPTSEDHLGMYKYNTSSDSLCSAARCRPRYSNQQPKKNSPSECSSQSSQSMPSSVLTDSPQSVSPSGILAPDNSSNTHQDWPGFYDYYSNANINPLPNLQMFCPGLPTNYLMFNPTFADPVAYYMSSTGVKNYSVSAADCQTKVTSHIGTCYPPHTASSDVKFITPQQSLVNYHNQAPSSAVSTATSVSKDHMDNMSTIVMPACVVPDPSKIKNKYSLRHKLRKFRKNVYKKTKKFTHLHICE